MKREGVEISSGETPTEMGNLRGGSQSVLSELRIRSKHTKS